MPTLLRSHLKDTCAVGYGIKKHRHCAEYHYCRPTATAVFEAWSGWSTRLRSTAAAPQMPLPMEVRRAMCLVHLHHFALWYATEYGSGHDYGVDDDSGRAYIEYVLKSKPEAVEIMIPTRNIRLEQNCMPGTHVSVGCAQWWHRAYRERYL